MNHYHFKRIITTEQSLSAKANSVEEALAILGGYANGSYSLGPTRTVSYEIKAQQIPHQAVPPQKADASIPPLYSLPVPPSARFEIPGSESAPDSGALQESPYLGVEDGLVLVFPDAATSPLEPNPGSPSSARHPSAETISSGEPSENQPEGQA